jgi:hypothetical protein
MGVQDDGYEDGLYDQFPTGEEQGIRPENGFNSWVHINDPKWFTDEALENPVIKRFVKAPFAVSFALFKSSHRESEYFIHKPVRAMTGGVKKVKSDEDAIVGVVKDFPADARVPTLVINHERSLAKRITRSLVIADGSTAGQIIHKGPADEED